MRALGEWLLCLVGIVVFGVGYLFFTAIEYFETKWGNRDGS